jgi:succinoglycan biosynthesis transport protein ExoP
MFMQLIPEPSPPRSPDQARDIQRLERKLDEVLSSLEPAYQASAPEPPPAGLLTYWTTLKRRKFVIILAGIALAAAAWYYSDRQPKIYQARTTLEILEPDRGSMNMQNFSSGGNFLFSQETYLETQFDLLRSKSLLRRVGRNLLAAGVITAADLQQDDEHTTPDHPDPILRVSQINISPVRGTRLVEVGYNAKNPELASTVANSLAAEYVQQDVDTRVSSAEETRAWLQKQLEGTKERLEDSEARLQGYAKSSGLLYTSPKGNVAEQTEDKLQFLARDLSDAQAKRASLEAKYETLVKSPDSKADEADSAPLHEIQARLLDLRRQRAALDSVYTSEYSKVKELDAQIAALQDGEAKEYSRWLLQLYGTYKTELAHEKLLEDAYNQQAEVVSDQASKAIHYNVLKREVETNRNLYDALLAGMKEAGVNASARVRNARVVDAAEPPRLPFSPRPVQTSAVGLIAGLMLGAAFVLVSETRDRRVKSPGMAQSYLNVPELGVIPSTKPHLLPTARRASLVPGVEGQPRVRGLGGLQVFSRNQALKGSPVFEAFHSVVTSILSPGRSSNIPKVLVVTSGALHEGKSTVIGNLGLMAAQIGQRVVLLDGDLRNPRLHQIYRVPNEKGLSDLLLEPDQLADGVLARSIQQTEVPGLSLIPSGPVTDRVATMLHSQRLAEIVAQLRSEFDLVLIDTPPVLPFADARIFGKVADAVILVVRAGRTTFELALAAKARFVEDGLPVFGTILNDWNGKERPYEYGADRAYRR